jgi:integrase
MEKGLGSLKLQGKGWYLTVKINGKVYNHATGTKDLGEAKEERTRFIESLKRAENQAAVANGTGTDQRRYPQEVVTVDELLDDYITFMHTEKKCKDAQGREDKIDLHLRRWPGRLAASITRDELREYRKERKAAGKEDSTIDKELSMLRSAYIHGFKRQSPKRVLEVPYFPIVHADNVRTGFVEVAEYDSIKEQHCSSLKMMWMLAYHSGCRDGELKSLDWPQVQFDTKVIELEPRTTKNNEGRYLPFYGDMEVMLRKQKELADKLGCKAVLFWHPEDEKLGPHCVAGNRINSCRKLWNAAMKRAGLDGITPHDLRRSAVRNMTQKCGVAESRAMKIVGHKTNSMLKRYNIVALGDVQEVGEKMDDWMVKARVDAAAKPRLVPKPELTKKQRVRELHGQGKTVQQIAEQLGLSVPTVYYHISDEAQAATIKRNREYKRQREVA